MASGTTEGQSEENAAFALPPRQPSALANYSRRSKLAAAALLLVGLISFLYLVDQMIWGGKFFDDERHGPRINSADLAPRILPTPPHPEAASENAVPLNPAESANLNLQDDRNLPMVLAPEPSVTETTPYGDLPRIGDDGRKPWQVYARPFNGKDTRPRIAILVAGLGLQRAATDAAVARLPASVTLAFEVTSPALASWCTRARQEGHEILISVPMEPFDFPHSDPGPHTLLTSLSDSGNLDRLNWALRQASGYVGITTLSGSRFTTEGTKLTPIMQSLSNRGLLMVDAHIAPHSAVTDIAHELHVPSVEASLRIDEDNLTPEAIDASLQQLEQTARLNGSALAVVTPLPVVLDHLQSWLKTLPQDGIALAPVSAVVK
jgi:uncharacterized protein